MNNALPHQLVRLANDVSSYIVLVGIFYACVFILGAFFIGCWEALGADPAIASYFRKIGRLALFLMVLLVVGDFYGVMWNAVVHGRMYHSPGYEGLDFVPWYPVTRALLDDSSGANGGLIGVKFWQLQGIWFVFAIATWSTTLLVYERVSPAQVFSLRRRARMRA